MLDNQSSTANEDLYPGQIEKERDRGGINPGAVEELKSYLIEKTLATIDIEIFSNETISKIFHHIIKVCRQN